MNVYKFYSGKHFYGYCGETEEEAKNQLFEDFGEMMVSKTEEILESDWDKKEIEVYMGNYPQLVFTNDQSIY